MLDDPQVLPLRSIAGYWHSQQLRARRSSSSCHTLSHPENPGKKPRCLKD